MNKIYIDSDTYGSDNEHELWEDITTIMKILTKNGYILSFDKDLSLYTITYDLKNIELADSCCYWLNTSDSAITCKQEENK